MLRQIISLVPRPLHVSGFTETSQYFTMPLYQKLPNDLNEVDIVVAGGGSAGCVVAGRLAAADPSLSILLIEQGRDNYDLPSVINPVYFPFNLDPRTKTAIFHKGNEAKELNGRQPIVPTGGVLGGGSSINFMLLVPNRAL